MHRGWRRSIEDNSRIDLLQPAAPTASGINYYMSNGHRLPHILQTRNQNRRLEDLEIPLSTTLPPPLCLPAGPCDPGRRRSDNSRFCQGIGPPPLHTSKSYVQSLNQSGKEAGRKIADRRFLFASIFALSTTVDIANFSSSTVLDIRHNSIMVGNEVFLAQS